MRRAAVFLDRDGTLITHIHYLRRPEQVALLPGAAVALRQLREGGFVLILVSNQAGVGYGVISKDAAQAVHGTMQSLLSEQGVTLDASYYCEHTPAQLCRCRKPSDELLRQAANDLRVDLDASFMIGDKYSDVAAGLSAGCRTALLLPARDGPTAKPHFMANTWEDVVEFICGQPMA